MIKRLVFNSLSNLSTLGLQLSITFVMTPILIRNLGHYDYGLWEMIGSIIGYMGMLDLGVRPAVSRFAARYIAQNDISSLRRLYATSWYFLLAVGMLIGLIMFLWAIFFAGSIGEPGKDSHKYTYLLLILGAQLLITFPSYTAESYMEAYQEYYLKNYITMFNIIVGNAAIFYFINPENALIVLASANAIGICSKYLFYMWYMQYRRNFLRIRSDFFSYAQLKELFSFSIKTVIQGISYRIETATDSLVIGFMWSPAMVPLYSVPANLVNYIRMVCFNITHVFMPYFSSLSALKEKEKIVSVYLMSSKITVGVILVLAIGVSLLGPDFLRIWVGSQIADSAATFMYILVAFTVLPMLNPFASRYLTAIDQHIIFAKWQPLAALANFLLSLALIGPLGMVGVALGSLIPCLIFQPFVLWNCCKHLEISIFQYCRYSLIPLIIPSLVMIVIILKVKQEIIVNDYAKLLVTAFFAAMAFIIIAFFVSFKKEDREKVFNLVRQKV